MNKVPWYQRFFSRAGHYKDLTETGNRARKVSGTKGMNKDEYCCNWHCSQNELGPFKKLFFLSKDERSYHHEVYLPLDRVEVIQQ